jgi:hypothetical protein
MKNNQSVYFIKGAKYRKWPKRVAQMLVAERIMVRR